MKKKKNSILKKAARIVLLASIGAGLVFGFGVILEINLLTRFLVALISGLLLVAGMTAKSILGVSIIYDQKFGVVVGSVVAIIVTLIFSVIPGLIVGIIFYLIFSAKYFVEKINKLFSKVKKILFEIKESVF